MPLTLLVPAFLLGLAALAVPILVHLSRRQTKEPVQFPSLMFLKKIPQQVEQRRQIHRWPLLLLRCLAIALLVFAFSRPFLDRQGAAAALPTQGSREVAILVDRSYSMGIGDRWEKAVEAAQEAIAGLATGDRATLIFFDAGAEAPTESTIDHAVLRGALQDAEPGTGTTRYAPALRYASRVLTASPLGRHEIVVISDFQAAGWDTDVGETAALRLPRGLVVTPIRVAETDSAYNVTVSGADLARSTVEGRERVAVTARLTSNGIPPASIPVRLEVNGRSVESSAANFGEGNTANVTFAPLTLPETGYSRGTIRVDSDILEADNALNFTLSSDQRMGVLIVNGPAVAAEASYFLERALSIGDSPGFRVEVRRSGQLTATDIAANPVIILHQAGIPAGEIGDRMRAHVERGGGLIMLTGDNALGDWPGVLPSVPGSVDRRNDGGTNIGYVDTGHPVFEVFAGPRTGDFSGAHIYRYRPVPSSSFPRILARFGDGGVALAERPVEGGRLLVWTSPLDGNWNDIALQGFFLPVLHQMVKYAAGYNPGRSWLTVGDPFDLRSLGPAAAGFDVMLTPSGERSNLAGETDIQLSEVGFYELRSSGGGPTGEMTLAVNIDPAEAEPTAFDPEEMRTTLLAAAGMDVNSQAGAGMTIVERERQQRGWWYVVILAFAILIAETWFSNRATRRRGSGDRAMGSAK